MSTPSEVMLFPHSWSFKGGSPSPPTPPSAPSFPALWLLGPAGGGLCVPPSAAGGGPIPALGRPHHRVCPMMCMGEHIGGGFALTRNPPLRTPFSSSSSVSELFFGCKDSYYDFCTHFPTHRLIFFVLTPPLPPTQCNPKKSTSFFRFFGSTGSTLGGSRHAGTTGGAIPSQGVVL